MALAVKQDEAPDPMLVLRFRTNAVMLDPDLVADLIEQFREVEGNPPIFRGPQK